MTLRTADLPAYLRHDSLLLMDPKGIEMFLRALDGQSPDWVRVYGQGHDDPDFDERLFTLNRERDNKRKGKEALGWRVTFLWPGELSTHDSESGGFAIAVGPAFIRTQWGIVRFKPDDLPSNLLAVPEPSLHDRVLRMQQEGKRVEIQVAMTGHLTPEESLVYDFSHDEEGQGLIMPVVQVEQVRYIFVEPP